MLSPGMIAPKEHPFVERLTTLLATIRANARWPMRRWREIRFHTDDTIARLVAVDLRSFDGKQLGAIEIYDIGEIEKITAAVFGKRQVLDDAVTFYRENGFAKPFPARRSFK